MLSANGLVRVIQKIQDADIDVGRKEKGKVTIFWLLYFSIDKRQKNKTSAEEVE